MWHCKKELYAQTFHLLAPLFSQLEETFHIFTENVLINVKPKEKAVKASFFFLT
jgi:hypothetical protein